LAAVLLWAVALYLLFPVTHRDAAAATLAFSAGAFYTLGVRR
jgi:hypothetical protein